MSDAKLAFLFPGQGAQILGMAVDLVESHDSARAVFDRARDVLDTDFVTICRDGPEDILNSTRVSQPAIFLHSMAVLSVVAEHLSWSRPYGVGLPVAGTAGLSLGEYSALVFAGVLEFDDALRLVSRRGEYMQEACDQTKGAMASVLGLDAASIEAVVNAARQDGLCVGVANYNSPQQTVISGSAEAVEATITRLKEAGARRAVPLRVAGAYHSELMASATQKLTPLLQEATFRPPEVPFYSNVTGRRVEDPEEIRDGLARQVESSVRWEAIVRTLMADGMTCAAELGPGKVLQGLVKNVDRAVPVTLLGTSENLRTIGEFAELTGLAE